MINVPVQFQVIANPCDITSYVAYHLLRFSDLVKDDMTNIPDYDGPKPTNGVWDDDALLHTIWIIAVTTTRAKTLNMSLFDDSIGFTIRRELRDALNCDKARELYDTVLVNITGGGQDEVNTEMYFVVGVRKGKITYNYKAAWLEMIISHRTASWLAKEGNSTPITAYHAEKIRSEHECQWEALRK